MADNCYVVEPLPSDNLPRTPFRRAALSRSHYNLRGPTAPRNPLGLLFYFPLSSPVPSTRGHVARRTLLRVAFRRAPRKRILTRLRVDWDIQNTNVLTIFFLLNAFKESNIHRILFKIVI